mmetsp:Transcript_21083/g.32660  ORF Transcript_21083/g.32660 Transcript_21083/m.32660 type:complete len:147 (+) Transcript_21083:2533-2973(+)
MMSFDQSAMLEFKDAMSKMNDESDSNSKSSMDSFASYQVAEGDERVKAVPLYSRQGTAVSKKQHDQRRTSSMTNQEYNSLKRPNLGFIAGSSLNKFNKIRSIEESDGRPRSTSYSIEEPSKFRTGVNLKEEEDAEESPLMKKMPAT